MSEKGNLNLETRSKKRVKGNPCDAWTWYEVAKNAQVKNLHELMEIARNLGITLNQTVRVSLVEGFKEYIRSRANA